MIERKRPELITMGKFKTSILKIEKIFGENSPFKRGAKIFRDN